MITRGQATCGCGGDRWYGRPRVGVPKRSRHAAAGRSGATQGLGEGGGESEYVPQGEMKMKKFWLLIGVGAGVGLTLGAQHCARVMRGEAPCPCEKLGMADACPCGRFHREVGEAEEVEASGPDPASEASEWTTV